MPAVGMFPETNHREGHVIARAHQSGGEKPMTINGPFILLDFCAAGGEGGIAAQASEDQQNQSLVVRPMRPCVPVLCPEVDCICSTPDSKMQIGFDAFDLMTGRNISLRGFPLGCLSTLYPPMPRYLFQLATSLFQSSRRPGGANWDQCARMVADVRSRYSRARLPLPTDHLCALRREPFEWQHERNAYALNAVR